MAVPLRIGKYFGAVSHQNDFPAAVLTEVAYSSERAPPAHRHDAAYFCLLIDDLIGAVFSAPESGGAIQFDSDQPIVVNSRLYTPSRPAPTNGMGVPGLAESGATVTAVLTSLSHSADSSAGFRSNVGAYNANDVTQVITFTLYDPAGTQIGQVSAGAPPRSSVQVNNVFTVAGFTRDVPDAYCVVQGDQNLPLIAYAGVIDTSRRTSRSSRGKAPRFARKCGEARASRYLLIQRHCEAESSRIQYSASLCVFAFSTHPSPAISDWKKAKASLLFKIQGPNSESVMRNCVGEIRRAPP